VTPKSILQDALQPDNQRGEGGTMLYYPARHPQLKGVGLLVPRRLILNRHPVPLPEAPLSFQPALPNPLHAEADVGVVLGTIGPITLVRSIPGEVVAPYLDLPCPDKDSGEFLHYFHNIDRFRALPLAERREDIRRILADPHQAKQNRVIPLLLQSAFFKQLEGSYLNQIQRLAALDDSVYQKAFATLLKIRAAGYGPDFTHPMNLLLSEENPGARFGFIDLAWIDPDKTVPAKTVMLPLEMHLLGFGLNLLGGGLSYFGPLWLMVSDEAEIALNRDIPTLIQKLERAAQRNELVFPTQELKTAIKRRANLPSLHALLSP
jgi:hypothetical protein